MTGRILAAFLGVLMLVLAAIVVPLGLAVTKQQADDFRAEAHSAARAIGAVAEERLDDSAGVAVLDTVVGRFVAGGDRVAVLDSSGRLVAHGGQPIPTAVLTAATAGQPPPAVADAVVATTPIRDGTRTIGVAVLVRGDGPLDRRRALLWTTLIAAAAGALVIGGLVGWSLGRWISKPLTSLADAAHNLGRGDRTTRAPTETGPQQIRDVGVAFNDMAARITQLLEAQRSMTAEVSHQLRTPLAALRLRLELLAPELDTASAEEVVAMIEETTRLARLADGLLAVARAEATSPEPEDIDLRALARARAEAWQPVAAERGISLCLDAESAVASARPGHAEQILDNLLDNAIEALPAGGQITVRVRSNDHEVVMTVADNGPGMSAERRAHALDQFVTDRGGAGGTGLGLAIVRRLVTTDHGRLRLQETPGGGLTIEVTLPAC